MVKDASLVAPFWLVALQIYVLVVEGLTKTSSVLPGIPLCVVP